MNNEPVTIKTLAKAIAKADKSKRDVDYEWVLDVLDALTCEYCEKARGYEPINLMMRPEDHEMWQSSRELAKELINRS